MSIPLVRARRRMDPNLWLSRTIMSSTLFLSLFFTVAQSIGSCYTPGPAFPVPSLSESVFKSTGVSSKIDSLIASILSQPPTTWNPINSSFAIQITSARETLWSSYYTAPVLGEYLDGPPTPVTGDTVFRIASVSKTFTVYALLLENGISLDDPITKYLPELREVDEDRLFMIPLEWDQITIRSLASQLSGLRRGNGNPDLAMLSDDGGRDGAFDAIALGLPPIAWNDTELKPCMKNATDRPCTRAEILEIARSQPPIFSPNDRSTYSNIAYTLLGLALENVTSTNFSEIISSSILKPLGMDRTGTIKPNDSMGIIPSGPTDWRPELGPDNPSGGIYTTANDLSKYLRSILDSTLLPKSVINDWMKPHSWASSGPNSAYGMPWEILRTTKLTPDHRPIDIITKGGSLGGYFSTIAVIPEFGLGLTILVAGAQAAQFDLREQIIALLIPELDKVVRAKAKNDYEGFYGLCDDLSGPLNPDSSVVLEVDDVGPGLRLSSWISNKTDLLPTYGLLKGMPEDPSQWEARLLPTGMLWDANWEAWRLTAIPQRKEEDEGKVFDDYCFTDVDGLIYGGWSLEEFLVHISSHEDDDDDGSSSSSETMLMNTGTRTLLRKGDREHNVLGTDEKFTGTTEERLRSQGKNERLRQQQKILT